MGLPVIVIPVAALFVDIEDAVVIIALPEPTRQRATRPQGTQPFTRHPQPGRTRCQRCHRRRLRHDGFRQRARRTNRRCVDTRHRRLHNDVLSQARPANVKRAVASLVASGWRPRWDVSRGNRHQRTHPWILDSQLSTLTRRTYFVHHDVVLRFRVRPVWRPCGERRTVGPGHRNAACVRSRFSLNPSWHSATRACVRPRLRPCHHRDARNVVNCAVHSDIRLATI